MLSCTGEPQFKRICIFLLPIISIWVGIALYSKGFLLTRHELGTFNSCENGTKCWEKHELPYNKVILVIIDALRFDFAKYGEGVDVPYRNKLKVFRDLARNEGCGKARLFRFHADAPTTTMQRIKGMFTGGFPTFIDISNNFASSHITEDNILDQVGGRIVFMGDDTWMTLFPGRFERSYPFPSFDVKDLHTVDNGILKHLFNEIKTKDWNLIIAHFLGVDHCGHRYGPLHPEMGSKLEQMDEMLRLVVERMDDETLLLVMGDHGMTQTGDHGGDSVDETTSALFAYSPLGGFDGNLGNDLCLGGVVQQVDLVPTLSYIFNTSIPSSNLGTIVMDLFDPNTTNHQDMLHVNLDQAETYLTNYNQQFNIFNTEDFLTLKNLLQNAKSGQNPKHMISALERARELCKLVWACFNVPYMVVGLLFVATQCLWCVAYTYFTKRTQKLSVFLTALTTVISMVSIFHQKFITFSLFSTICLFILTVTNILHNFKTFKKFTRNLFLQFILVTLVYLTHQALYASNSFVINEDKIQQYFFTSVIFFLFMKDLTKMTPPKTTKNIKFTKLLTHHLLLPCILYLMLLIIIRVSSVFQICRPEQHWCYKFSTQESTSGLEESFKVGQTQLNTSLVSLFSIIGLIYFILKSSGNLRNKLSPAVVVTTKLLPFTAVLIFLDWQIQAIDQKVLEQLPPFYSTFLPRCSFVILLFSLLWWIVNPLAVHLMHPGRGGQYRDELTGEDLIAKYFQKLRDDNDVLERGRKGLPAVFGLYRVLSSALLGFNGILMFVLLMLLGPTHSHSMLLLCTCTWMLLEVTTDNRKSHTVPWGVVAIWTMSSSVWWFGTGHQASVTTLPWHAAFVAVKGNHPTVVLPAVMVGANVFASQVLHTVLLPLLLLWPITRRRQRDNSVCDNEFDFMTLQCFWNSIHDLFMKHTMLHCMKMFCCMVASFILRRHLMVWQIFAPRYLFELLSFFVVCLTSVFIYFFIIRVVCCVERWVEKTNKILRN
uniref:GPI ethanolamine phosphate transferase 3-like isoform X2 n=1 Tax=Ciona intestinalis TaxID=7719 RepID=UPI00089DCB18|nr:GPI ethanolamine phosphate transferase 3-like isoform X2 [Ciona intestinalis]|eukprot:XP_018670604.1 GPI ethanolamine phosphate transferase 3-like isoform X2 [Ciona intestinalis]